MTASVTYRAPFAPGGPAAIDGEICRKLLEVALGRGGDYADLFFEYRAAGGLSFEEGITRSASRGVSMGLGVRVQRGRRHRLRARRGPELGRDEARGRNGGAHRAPEAPRRRRWRSSRRCCRAATSSIGRRSTSPGSRSAQLLERASKAALAFDSAHRQGRAHASPKRCARSWSSRATAALPRRAAADALRRARDRRARRPARGGRSGGGGRMTLGYFDDKSPEWHAEEAARQALVLLDARQAPAGPDGSRARARATAASCCTKRSATGSRPTSTARAPATTPGSIGKPVASELCTVVDDATLLQSRGSINVDDEGIEPHKSVLIENGSAARLHARSAERTLVQDAPDRQRPARELRLRADAAHDQHRAARRPHDPEEIVRASSAAFSPKVRRRAGRHLERRLRLLADRELPDRRRRITAPLKGVNLIGNGPETLRDVTMLGNDVAVSDGIWTCGKDGQSVPVGVGCPTIKIARITVGGTEIALTRRPSRARSFVAVIGHGPMLEREEGAAATLRQLGATVRTLDLWDDPVNLLQDDDDELEVRRARWCSRRSIGPISPSRRCAPCARSRTSTTSAR